ncbi:MAG: hypothetical protein P1V51_23410 [Deltaproteobacteria bacterium]|nr:hypothetical protein [Deltaproteobacteria bacterium]
MGEEKEHDDPGVDEFDGRYPLTLGLVGAVVGVFFLGCMGFAIGGALGAMIGFAAGNGSKKDGGKDGEG